ncbi:methylenetetrahydrofolate reductase [Candidatus Pacearchaeota archaeon]|nr:methylenetetrahydrofolate reductase [Candidatus Pacearchaeota archaeon]
MKVTDHIKNSSSPLISFEITPPNEGTLEDAMNKVSKLAPYEPPFIDVTYHPVEQVIKRTNEGLEEVIQRKYPGTRTICSTMQRENKIDAVPHILCRGFSWNETHDLLNEIKFDGIENILVIQGDDKGYERPLHFSDKTFEHPSDLIPEIRKTFGDSFCIGVAGYPEKHRASPNSRTDLEFLKIKVDSGADYIVTQMFYNNKFYFKFVDRCRKAGINVPIIPGITVLSKKEHTTDHPDTFDIDIPYALSSKVDKATPEDAKKLGIEWGTKQVDELIRGEVPSAHFYVFSGIKSATMVIDNLNIKKNHPLLANSAPSAITS